MKRGYVANVMRPGIVCENKRTVVVFRDSADTQCTCVAYLGEMYVRVA